MSLHKQYTMEDVVELQEKMKAMEDEYAPNALQPVDASTAMDVFENAIRCYGVGNFAEYVGGDYRGEFATDQLEHLKAQYAVKTKPIYIEAYPPDDYSICAQTNGLHMWGFRKCRHCDLPWPEEYRTKK